MYDSDFHPLDPDERQSNAVPPKRAGVAIGRNVFIGSRSIILNGTGIGDGCVVASGSVVSGVFPPETLIGGKQPRQSDPQPVG